MHPRADGFVLHVQTDGSPSNLFWGVGTQFDDTLPNPVYY